MDNTYIVIIFFQISFLRINYIDLQLKIIAATQIMVNKCIIKIHIFENSFKFNQINISYHLHHLNYTSKIKLSKRENIKEKIVYPDNDTSNN